MRAEGQQEASEEPDALLFVPPVDVKQSGADRFVTWGHDGALNLQIVGQLQTVVTNFAQSGIRWTFGREQEFTLRPLGRIDQEALRTKKVATLTPMLDARLEAENIGRPVRSAMLAVFDKMSLQDVFMTELHLRLKDSLEPRFGKGSRGFYDPQGVLEASTRPADPVTDVVRWHHFNHSLQRQAEEYDFSVAYYKRDITFKAVDAATGKPLFQTQGNIADADQRGAPMAASILRTVYEALPVFMKPLQITDQIQQIDMGYGRHHAIRSQSDRLEMRTNHNPMAGSHPALENLLILGGAYHGLTQHKTPDYVLTVKPVTYGEKTVFAAPNTRLFFLQEMLNAAEVDTSGQLRLPGLRLFMKYEPYLRKELHLPESHKLPGWINRVRVTPEGIQWPNTAEISSDPAALTHNLAKISYGGKVARLQCPGYAAEQGLGLTSDINEGRRLRMAAAVEIMARSKILPNVLGPELSTQITDAFTQRYPTVSPSAPQRHASSSKPSLDAPVG